MIEELILFSRGGKIEKLSKILKNNLHNNDLARTKRIKLQKEN